MATANDTRFSDLKARLAVLNCELLEEEGTHAERYVIFDKAKRLIVSNGTTIEEQYDWLAIKEAERGAEARGDDRETVEDIKSDTADVLVMRKARKPSYSPATASDFNSPPVRDTYERFLSLVVMANLKDRLEAMETRRTRGVEAAVEFLNGCMLTSEDYEPYETTAQRRKRITKECDADAAIHEAEGVLWAVHGLAEILTLDNVRDDNNGVLSIGKSIIDQAERVLEFLDRAGGWDKP